MEQKQLAKELHAPARRRFPTRPFEVKGLHEFWQADLAEMSDLKKWNGGHKYILVVIDVLSKVVFARPVKKKDSASVSMAMKNIIKQAKVSPKNLQTDEGREFFNRTFRNLMDKYHINHYHTYSKHKAAVAERMVRTLKTRLYRFFTENNSLNWTKHLQDVVNDYNNTKHRTIKMAPSKVTRNNAGRVKKIIEKGRKKRKVIQRFRVGDLVRISQYKKVFDKAYKQNWSEELFKITRVMPTSPRVYHLSDLMGEDLKGTFYGHEMKKTKIPTYARIEKVLRKKTLKDGQKLLRVRWKGYGSAFDSWISPASATHFSSVSV